MIHASHAPAWRAAALRGLSRSEGHEEALVALSADQYLRIPVALERVDALRACLGRRVWVDMNNWALRLDQPAKVGHA